MIIKQFMLTSTKHEFATAHKSKCLKIKAYLDFKLSDVVFIILINDKCQLLLSF